MIAAGHRDDLAILAQYDGSSSFLPKEMMIPRSTFATVLYIGAEETGPLGITLQLGQGLNGQNWKVKSLKSSGLLADRIPDRGPRSPIRVDDELLGADNCPIHGDMQVEEVTNMLRKRPLLLVFYRQPVRRSSPPGRRSCLPPGRRTSSPRRSCLPLGRRRSSPPGPEALPEAMAARSEVAPAAAPAAVLAAAPALTIQLGSGRQRQDKEARSELVISVLYTWFTFVLARMAQGFVYLALKSYQLTRARQGRPPGAAEAISAMARMPATEKSSGEVTLLLNMPLKSEQPLEDAWEEERVEQEARRVAEEAHADHWQQAGGPSSASPARPRRRSGSPGGWGFLPKEMMIPRSTLATEYDIRAEETGPLGITLYLGQGLDGQNWKVKSLKSSGLLAYRIPDRGPRSPIRVDDELLGDDNCPIHGDMQVEEVTNMLRKRPLLLVFYRQPVPGPEALPYAMADIHVCMYIYIYIYIYIYNVSTCMYIYIYISHGLRPRQLTRRLPSWRPPRGLRS